MKEFTGTVVCIAGVASISDLAIAFPEVAFRVEFVSRIENVTVTLKYEEVRTDYRDLHIRRYIVTDSMLVRAEVKAIVDVLSAKTLELRRAPFIAKYGSLITAIQTYGSGRDHYNAINEALDGMFPEVHIEIGTDPIKDCLLVEIYGPEGWTVESMTELHHQRWHQYYIECPTCGTPHRRNN
jgi:hypothetical protein